VFQVRFVATQQHIPIGIDACVLKAELKASEAMKLVLALLVITLTFCSADSSVEERLRTLEDGLRQLLTKNTALEADNAAMKADNVAMKADNVAMKAQRSASTAGELKMFVGAHTTCPEGYREPNVTQGMLLVGRPRHGKTGAAFNRPLDAGEIGRTPDHSHTVTVDDPGHTHASTVNDPGHGHGVEAYRNQGMNYQQPDGCVGDCIQTTQPYRLQQGPLIGINQSKTGITINSQHTKSAIQVSVDANSAGEDYPLVYVLICQKLP
jgi:hypothetical protein